MFRSDPSRVSVASVGIEVFAEELLGMECEDASESYIKCQQRYSGIRMMRTWALLDNERSDCTDGDAGG